MAEAGVLPQLVIDPVMVDRHGELYHPILSGHLPRIDLQALIVTPNHLEAMHLLGVELTDDIVKICEAALELAALGPEVVLITGGRRNANSMIDVMAHRRDHQD